MNVKTILIADDDNDFSDVLAIRCRGLGLAVEQAKTATAALARIEYGLPDAVCLDINMPPGNGLAVIEMLRGDERLSAIPTIVMTGYIDQDAVRRCRGLHVPLVRKGRNGWNRIESLLCELLQLESNDSDTQLISPQPLHA
jgi:CheY-like chemotaxis protein